MRTDVKETRGSRRNPILTTAAIMALVLPSSLILTTAPRLQAQVSATQAPAITQWQTAAGGKLAFDAASVKPDAAPRDTQTVHSNVPLDDQDGFSPTGGLLSSTNYALLRYIIFAY
jgi:hypothetical protein